MPDKLHKTRGIVLRSVKYGETSVIVTIFTELFGIQSYIINGIRTASKKGSSRSAFFQPAAILDLVVYHNELKHLNRVREFRWAELYDHIYSDVPKNAVALFIIELLTKCLKQPEANSELFGFCEDILLELDRTSAAVTANLPLFFALHLTHFFGFRIDDNYSERKPYLDLQEGSFVAEKPDHPYFLEDRQALIASQILKARVPEELTELRLHSDFRRHLLQQIENYYGLHIQEFGKLKTLPVLRELLS